MTCKAFPKGLPTEVLKRKLRIHPDWIIVGEDRRGLALLKAWNFGHPGELATSHANGPRKGLSRLE